MLTGPMWLNVFVKRTEIGGDIQDEQATKVCGVESHSPIGPVGPQNAGSQAYLKPGASGAWRGDPTQQLSAKVSLCGHWEAG